MKTYFGVRKEKIPCLLAIAGAIIYISLIFNDNLWMDEAFSASLIRDCSLAKVLERSAADTLPPLYNVLNYFITCMLGYHAWAMKLLSALPMIISMFAAAFVVRKRFGVLVSSLFIMCLWGMPTLLFYGVEIRMYSLGFMFALLTGMFAIESYYAKEKKENLRSFALMMLFACGAGYTHHFAFVTAGFCYGILLLGCIFFKRNKLKYWLVFTVLTLLLYVPCLLTTMGQMKRVSGYFTMPDASLHFVLQCMRLPFTTNVTAVSAILIVVFIAVVLAEIILNRDFLVLSGVLIYPGILAFGVLAGKLLGANIFTDRYLVPSIGFLWLSFAISVKRLATYLSAKAAKMAVMVIAIFIAVCDIICYSGQFKSEYAGGVEEMKRYFAENVEKDDKYVIFEGDYQIEICFRYYFPEFEKIKPEEIDSEAGVNIWYLKVPGYEDREAEITGKGYMLEKAGDFSFDRYEFSLYKIKR